MKQLFTPHGPGFSFVDSLVSGPGNNQLRATKFLDPASPFFADHFPSNPIMPAVLLIECAAQAAGCLWTQIVNNDRTISYRLAQVLGFKVLAPVYPDQTIITEVSLDRLFDGLGQFSAVIYRDEQVVANGKIVLANPVLETREIRN